MAEHELGHVEDAASWYRQGQNLMEAMSRHNDSLNSENWGRMNRFRKEARELLGSDDSDSIALSLVTDQDDVSKEEAELIRLTIAVELARRFIADGRGPSQTAAYGWSLVRLGQLLHRLGRDQETIELCNEFDEFCRRFGSPENPDARNALHTAIELRGEALAAQGEYARAMADIERAIPLDADCPRTWYLSVICHAAEGRVSELRENLPRYLEHDPEALALVALLPNAVEDMTSYLEQVRLAGAKSMGKRASYPESPAHWMVVLGTIRHRAGQYEQAQQTLESVAREIPEVVAPHHRHYVTANCELAHVYFFLSMNQARLGDSESAQKWFDKGVSLERRLLYESVEELAWDDRLLIGIYRKEARAVLDEAAGCENDGQ